MMMIMMINNFGGLDISRKSHIADKASIIRDVE